jgi:hypothetical protein
VFFAADQRVRKMVRNIVFMAATLFVSGKNFSLLLNRDLPFYWTACIMAGSVIFKA